MGNDGIVIVHTADPNVPGRRKTAETVEADSHDGLYYVGGHRWARYIVDE